MEAKGQHHAPAALPAVPYDYGLCDIKKSPSVSLQYSTVHSVATIYREPAISVCSTPAQKQTQQVSVVAFPASKTASHRNAGLLGLDAVSACFPTVRRKLVSSFSTLSGPRVSAFRLLYGKIYVAVART